MRRLSWAAVGATATAAAAVGAFLYGSRAFAHCDTLDGPVVTAAKKALESGDVTPILKWVRAEDETEMKALFKKVLAVRKQGGDARELADRAFFENLVRVHRAGEGEPFTGLLPAGTPVERGIGLADSALETGNLATLQATFDAAMEKALKERYQRVVDAKPHAEESVAKGRAYVAAYVEFIHFVERLNAQLGAEPGAHGAHAEHVH